MSEQIMILRNDKGEDIYSINKSIKLETLGAIGAIPAKITEKNIFSITPLKPSIDILEPLTIYNRDVAIGTINMCEILMGAISDVLDNLYDEKSDEAFEKDEAETDVLKRIWNPTTVTINPELDSFRTALTIEYNQYQDMEG